MKDNAKVKMALRIHLELIEHGWIIVDALKMGTQPSPDSSISIGQRQQAVWIASMEISCSD